MGSTTIYSKILTYKHLIYPEINNISIVNYNHQHNQQTQTSDRREHASEASIDNILSYLTDGISKLNSDSIHTVAEKFINYISTLSKEEVNNLFDKSITSLNDTIINDLVRRYKIECWRTKPSYNWSKAYKIKSDEKVFKTLCSMDYKSNLMVHMTLKVDTDLYNHDEAVKNITSSLTHLKRTLKDNKLSILKSAGIVEFHCDENSKSFEYPHLHLFLEIQKTSNIDIQKRLIRKIVRKSWRLRDTKRKSLDIGEVKFIASQDHFDNACPYCVFSPKIKGSKYKKQSELPHRYDHHHTIQRMYISKKNNVKSVCNNPAVGIVESAGDYSNNTSSEKFKYTSCNSKSRKTIGDKRSIIATTFKITDMKNRKSDGRRNIKGFQIDIPFEIVKKVSNKGFNEDKALVTYFNKKSLSKFIQTIFLYRYSKISSGRAQGAAYGNDSNFQVQWMDKNKSPNMRMLDTFRCRKNNYKKHIKSNKNSNFI